jgi:hypothetical protein
MNEAPAVSAVDDGTGSINIRPNLSQIKRPYRRMKKNQGNEIMNTKSWWLT